MSLAVLADHMASKGRGPDSMLIHMAPNEVAGLQALAMAHGGSLTINPETGLPEAGFLSKLLPAVIGFALNSIAPGVGEAVAGLWGGAGGAAAGTAALVGGVQTARTGSLAEGVQAGLGAYGGAGLSESLIGAGANTLAGQSIGSGLTADMAANLADAGVPEATMQSNIAAANQAVQQQALSPVDKIAAGAKAVAANPASALTKDNFKYLAAAAAPILADQAVKSNMPTTTTTPGMIRPYSYDPYSGGFVAANPYEAQVKKAADGGVMGFDESANAPITRENLNAMGRADGMFNYAHDGGGVMRMAEGGIAGYADGGPPVVLSDVDLFKQTGDWNKAAALRDQQNNALNQYNWQQQADARDQAARAANIAADAARLSGTTNTNTNTNANAAAPVDYNKLATQYVSGAMIPTETTEQFITGANKAGIGLTAPLATALQNSGLSAAAQYALTHANIGPNENAEETYGGLKGLSSNINYIRGGLQDQIAKGKLTGQNAREQALSEMNKYGVNEADIIRATGKTLKELFPDTVTKPVSVIPTGFYGNDTGNPLTSTPGDIHTNPDGTVTVTPNIPGRPTGGFTGMGQVKDAYTAGGGSLGYTPYVPTSIADFNAKYNTLTGGSKDAYDYLTGKSPYPLKPSTPTGELQKPYWESVGNAPINTSKKMYLFDPVTKQYKINPDYAIPTYDAKGNKVYNVTNKDVIAQMATKPSPADFYTWAKTNNLSIEQIAAATGMPITEVQKMFTSGAPKDTSTTSTASTSSDTQLDSSGTGGQAAGGLAALTMAGGGMADHYNLGGYSDGGRLLRGPGDGVSDSIPATIGNRQPARLADGEFVVPARIVSELGNGSTEAGARKLYGMMDRIQAARRGTVGKDKVAKNSRADKYLPA